MDLFIKEFYQRKVKVKFAFSLFFAGVAVAVLDGFLYAIGGSDGTSPLASVEKFDPKSNQWISVRSMGTKRKHLGAAVFQGSIYAGQIVLLK